MGAMHLVFLIFSLTAFSPIANSNDAGEIFLKTTLEKAGLTTFSSLIAKTGVLKSYAENKKGLTIFAPSDSAFNPKILAALKTLTPEQVVELLMYHAVADYLPLEKLKATKGAISTLAAYDDVLAYTLRTSTDGDHVIVVAEENLSLIDETVNDSNPLVIFKIEKVLLPSEIFGKSPVPTVSP